MAGRLEAKREVPECVLNTTWFYLGCSKMSYFFFSSKVSSSGNKYCKILRIKYFVTCLKSYQNHLVIQIGNIIHWELNCPTMSFLTHEAQMPNSEVYVPQPLGSVHSLNAIILEGKNRLWFLLMSRSSQGEHRNGKSSKAELWVSLIIHSWNLRFFSQSRTELLFLIYFIFFPKGWAEVSTLKCPWAFKL